MVVCLRAFSGRWASELLDPPRMGQRQFRSDPETAVEVQAAARPFVLGRKRPPGAASRHLPTGPPVSPGQSLSSARESRCLVKSRVRLWRTFAGPCQYGPVPRLVKYPQYRDHEQQRIQTNDTMMGLLAASKLASQTLSLTEGSQLVLSQIFPGVPHIERFNLRTDRARAVLNDAENLLGILAVPQVIALHEDLLRGTFKLLAGDDPRWKDLDKHAKAATVHATLSSETGVAFTAESIELFHLVRVARNTHIHSGGRAGQTLLNKISNVSPAALESWERITGTTFPQYLLGQPVALGLSELIGILAITKRLAEEANMALQATLSRVGWADIAVRDWARVAKAGNPTQQLRQVVGVTRRYYAPIDLAEDELSAAMARAGHRVEK